MTNVVFVNLSDPKYNGENVGDLNCSPISYFQSCYENHTILDVSEVYDPKENDVCVLGGGGLFSNWHGIHLDRYLKFKKKIVWGAGENTHTDHLIYHDLDYNEYLKKFDIVGLRHKTKNYEFVPCVSCMSEVFDKQYIVQDDIVVYEHMNYPIPIKHKKTNNVGTSLEEKITFLASGNKIITNSYHGLYWGILLKKSVVIYKPQSTRLTKLPFKLETCDEFNYNEKLEKSIKYDFLQSHRQINIAFNKKVIDFINNVINPTIF